MERLPNKSYVKNILKLLDLGRLNFCNSKKELLNIANRHSIVTSFKIDDEFNEINIVNELIVWSKNSLNEQNIIDYVDMIYLPNILNLKTFEKIIRSTRSKLVLTIRCSQPPTASAELRALGLNL